MKIEAIIYYLVGAVVLYLESGSLLLVLGVTLIVCAGFSQLSYLLRR